MNLWPEEYFERNIIDKRTAVVLLTHDPKIDDQGIHAALNSNAFYIGCLGSKRTHSKRLAGLKMLGLMTNNSKNTWTYWFGHFS